MRLIYIRIINHMNEIARINLIWQRKHNLDPAAHVPTLAQYGEGQHRRAREETALQRWKKPSQGTESKYPQRAKHRDSKDDKIK